MRAVSRPAIGGARPGGLCQQGGRPFCVGWWQDWSDKPLVLVASGPSAGAVDFGAAVDRCRFFAVNESWRLCRRPDGTCFAAALYAADGAWWKANPSLPGFDGLKFTQDATIGASDPDIHRFELIADQHRLLLARAGEIGNGTNSGFQALNVALQFGARDIALVGYDLRIDLGLHWHGAHGAGLNDPAADSTARWRRWLDAAAPQLEAIGARVVNLSPVSALTAYPKMTMDQWLTSLSAAPLPPANPVARRKEES